jgi:hypothetical protein
MFVISNPVPDTSAAVAVIFFAKAEPHGFTKSRDVISEMPHLVWIR